MDKIGFELRGNGCMRCHKAWDVTMGSLMMCPRCETELFDPDYNGSTALLNEVKGMGRFHNRNLIFWLALTSFFMGAGAALIWNMFV